MLEQVEFKDFRIGELFDTSLWKYSLQSQNFLSTSPVKTSTHDLAVVTGTIVNNSIAYYVNRDEVNESNIYSETLTMTTRGQSGVVKFQEEEFLLHNNSLALCGVFEKLNKNKKVVLYFMTALNKLGYGNSYSNFPTVKSLSEDSILLPVTSSGSVNYSYMESYISYIEKLHILRTEKLLQELGYNSLKDAELTAEDKEILRLFSGGDKLTLAEFKIGELFEIFCIHPQMQKSDFVYGLSSKSYPLIMQNKDNNGVESFISEQENDKISLVKGNKITMFTHLNRAFYQPDDFYCKQGGNIYILENENLNKNNALYLCSLINKAIQDVGYGKNTKQNFINKTIPLPINPQSPTIPNYSLMESYITAIEKLHVNKLISSHNQEITTLNTVTKKCTHKKTQQALKTQVNTSKHKQTYVSASMHM